MCEPRPVPVFSIVRRACGRQEKAGQVVFMPMPAYAACAHGEGREGLFVSGDPCA
jgi:hypothetical protein